jgi:tripartite ATP-independent transporter DctM subunit
MVSVLLLAVLLMVALIVIGAPVFVAIGLGAIVLLQSGILPPGLFGQSLFSGMNSFPFIAIPLFILTGSVIVETGLSQKLLDMTNALFGSLKTGVGTAVAAACGLFATISGSNSADTAAIGRIALDPLNQVGYPRSHAAALIASGSSTGILIPPSITYIIVGVVLGVSVSDLFRAALIPGFMILGGVILMNVFLNNHYGYEQQSEQAFSLSSVPQAIWDAKFGLLIPFIILGGIYSGIFTPTESAVVAVIVTFVIGFVQRTLSWGTLLPMIEESALVNAMVSPIIAVSLVLGQILTVLRIPAAIETAVSSVAAGPLSVVLVLLVVFTIAGATMEIGPNILILGPLFWPLADSVGMGKIHYSVFMMTVFGVGFITPPIGLNLYVIAGVSDEKVISVAKAAIPFVIGMLAIALLIGLYPVFSTVLL